MEFTEKAVADASATFNKVGITLPVNEAGGKKRAALIAINSKEQQIIGFAEVPTKMIDASNLQFSPAKENRLALER